MSAARALSSDDLAGLREELAAGGTPTIWFTSAAVGVPEGQSGKVIALDDPAEGDFIQVRPAGSKDVLSFSAGEVTVVKPPRKRKKPEGPPAPKPHAPASAEAPASVPRQTAPEVPAAEATATTPSDPPQVSTTSGPRRTSAARKQPSGAALTITADTEGQWTVEVVVGKKRALRPMQVSASAVAQAAKVLHSEVADAVEPVIEAAREQQRSRVEQLREELEHAERMLDDLTD